jgi:phosphate starvation-inducible PhoH-like protein
MPSVCYNALYEETAQTKELTSEMVHLMLQTSQAVTRHTVSDEQNDKFPVLYSRKGGIRPRGVNQAAYVSQHFKI